MESFEKNSEMKNLLKETSKVLALVAALGSTSPSEASAQEGLSNFPSTVELEVATQNLVTALEGAQELRQEIEVHSEELRQLIESKYGQEGLAIHDEIVRLTDEIARTSIDLETITAEMRAIQNLLDTNLSISESDDEATLERLGQESESMKIALENLNAEQERVLGRWEAIAD